MFEFKKWIMEGGFSNDQKASVQSGMGARGNGTMGPSKKKNPPDGMPTPSSNAPLALKDRATRSSQMNPMQMNPMQMQQMQMQMGMNPQQQMPR